MLVRLMGTDVLALLVMLMKTDVRKLWVKHQRWKHVDSPHVNKKTDLISKARQACIVMLIKFCRDVESLERKKRKCNIKKKAFRQWDLSTLLNIL